MTRSGAAVLALLLLAACEHMPLRSPEITPETLEAASPLGETFCSKLLRDGRSITWRCKVYVLGGRVLVGFHDILTGKLLAIGEQIGSGPRVVIRWWAPGDGDEIDVEVMVL